MAEGKDNVVRISFGVKGGGEISGDSGARIKRELNAIVQKISPLTIDVSLKSKSLEDIKGQLQKISGESKVNIDVELSTESLKKVKGQIQNLAKGIAPIKLKTANDGTVKGSGKKGAETPRTQRNASGEQQKILREFSSITKRLGKLIPGGGNEYNALKKQYEGLLNEVMQVLQKSPNLRSLYNEGVTGRRRNYELETARNEDREVEAKINNWIKLERQLANVTDETSESYKKLQEAAGDAEKEAKAAVDAIEGDHPKATSKLNNAEETVAGIRSDGNDKKVTERIKEWIKLQKELSKVVTTGVGNYEELEKAVDKAAEAVRDTIGKTYESDPRYTQAETEVKKIASEGEQKRNSKLDGNLQIRWERAVAGANSLNERYVDLIKNSKKAREAIDALYKAINKGQLTLDSDVPDPGAEGGVRKANINDITKQTQELEKLYKQTSGEMSKLEAKSHTLGNQIKDTFNSKLLQSFAYALVGLLTGALRKVYTNVVELDSAITDLQIATGKTREETTALVETYADLAKQLGATMTEVAEGADTWLRQGYSVEETTQLISDSMMLAKLGQLEAAEASKALTSAMKGYKVEVEDALSIVDKFTAVDMEAAVSAGDIATAMAETAASANVAGVSMDRLIGYISTVSEVTQDGAESVGNFYKTLFARMGNVKTGTFIDNETGERLNDVEGTLGALGIQLRDSSDTFRDFGDVLDEVGARWNSFTNVQQHAIATAFAGTRQQEKFIVLMENYGQAMEYANVAAESEGTATSKYNVAYLDSIEAKVNELTAAWQSFSMALLDSSLVKDVVEGLTTIVDVLDAIVSLGEGKLIPFMIGIPVAIAVFIKSFKTLKRETNLTASDIENSVSTTARNVTSTATAAAGQATAAVTTAGQTIKQKMAAIGATIKENAKLIKANFGQLLLNAVPALITTILGFVNSFDNAEGKIATAVLSIVGVIGTGFALIAAMFKAFKMSNPLGWILALISALITAISAIIDLVPTYEKLKEAAEEANSAWQEQATQLQETTDKIKELRNEVEELEAIDNPSITEESDIKRLNQEIALLEDKQRIQEEAARAAKREAVNAATDAWEKYIDEEWGGEEAYNSRVNTSLSKWDEASQESRQKILSTITEMQTLFGDFEYGYNQYLDQILDEYNLLLDRYTLATEGAEAVIESIADKGRYSNGVEQLKELARSDEFTKAAEITEDVVKEWINSQPDIAELFEYFKEVGIWDGENYAPLVEYVRDLRIELSAIAALDLASDIESTSSKFDGLASALEDVKKNGMLSLDTVKSLLEESPATLENYFDKTLEGYKLKSDFTDMDSIDILASMANQEISKYEEILKGAQKALEELTPEDVEYEQAVKNLAAAQDNLNTKMLEWNVLLREPAIEKLTEELETEQEALENQLETYKDLVDIRKDIIETYKEEQDYRKELERKQQNVSTLQAQLAAASLDNSAEGLARQRALREELDTAQEELDTYTLEHAIEDITLSMDNEYAEYEAYIKEQVNIIAEKIDNVSQLVGQILKNSDLAVSMSGTASEYVELKDKLKEMGVTADSSRGDGGKVSSYGQFVDAVEKGDWEAASAYYSESKKHVNESYEGNGSEDENPDAPPGYNELAKELRIVPGAKGSGIADGTSGEDGDNGEILYNREKYYIEAGAADSELFARASDAGIIKEQSNTYNGGLIGDRDIFIYKNTLYGYLNGKFIKLRGRYSRRKSESSPEDNREDGYSGLMGVLKANGVYHTGGFVGDITDLKSNEEFAKLLKGEFVSTPAQMDNFMKNILPSVTSYSNGATINNNSPLITIQCGTIDDETLPKLSDMVDAAVAKIERNMENALTRRGYRAGV